MSRSNRLLWILSAWMLAALSAAYFVAAADSIESPSTVVRQGPRPLKPSDHGVGRYTAEVEFRDLAGKSHRLSEFSAAKATVVCMTSVSCPLSKKYLPTLVDLAKAYAPRGVQFLLVNTVATDKPDEMQAAAASLGSHALYVNDITGTLSLAVGAKTTTDVVVLDATRTVIYHGAVDDQYGFGYSLDAPRRRYLAEALDAVLAGRSPEVAACVAPGCALTIETKASATPQPAVTYHNRISRILAQNCVECHRSGGVGPFDLTSAAEVSAHAAMIKQVVERGVMPPWFAAPDESGRPSPWANDRSLSAADKADLLTWLDGGRPLGDRRDGIAPTPRSDEWQIGKPDAVFEFAQPVSIKATGVMPYRNVVVETNLPEERWVQAIEIQPGVLGVVHHVLVFAMQGDESDSEQDDQAEGRGGYWAIYVPGNSTQIFPQGFAKRLPKGAKLRFQMHYTPSGMAVEDRTRIGLIFADQPPEHEVRVAGVVNVRLRIPPGADNHEEVATLRLPFDVQVLGFLPHMHLRGKACRYEVIDADGDSQTLLDIPRYDFNWQLLYNYFDPLPLERGTTLKFTAWFDNSDKNPANPDATQTVRWGPQTYDEMHLGYVEYYVPGVKPGETPSLSPVGRFTGGARDGSNIEKIFRSLDRNDDGELAGDEIPAGQRENLLRLDANKDGVITLAEAQRLLKLLRPRP